MSILLQGRINSRARHTVYNEVFAAEEDKVIKKKQSLSKVNITVK